MVTLGLHFSQSDSGLGVGAGYPASTPQTKHLVSGSPLPLCSVSLLGDQSGFAFLSASSEPSQLVAGEGTHEVGLIKGQWLSAPEVGGEGAGPRLTGIRAMPRLSLLVVSASRGPKYLQSPCLAYITTVPRIIIAAVILGSTH